MLPLGDFAARLVPYLHAAGLVGADATCATSRRTRRRTLALAAPLVQTRMTLLGEAPGMLGFFFVRRRGFEYDEAAHRQAARQRR